MKLFVKLFIGFHVFVYRVSKGKIMGKFGDNPVLLLNTVGRKSGKKRTIPLLYTKDNDSYLVAASNAGADNHPSWYYNLIHTPNITIEVQADALNVTANQVSGEERSRLWNKLVAMSDQYAGYAAKTTREIPLFLLTPIQ